MLRYQAIGGEQIDKSFLVKENSNKSSLKGWDLCTVNLTILVIKIRLQFLLIYGLVSCLDYLFINNVLWNEFYIRDNLDSYKFTKI